MTTLERPLPLIAITSFSNKTHIQLLQQKNSIEPLTSAQHKRINKLFTNYRTIINALALLLMIHLSAFSKSIDIENGWLPIASNQLALNRIPLNFPLNKIPTSQNPILDMVIKSIQKIPRRKFKTPNWKESQIRKPQITSTAKKIESLTSKGNNFS